MAEGQEPLLLPREALPGWWEPGFVVPGDEWQRAERMSRYHQMYDRACRLLTRREHFTDELRRKLSQRSREADLVDEVVAACQKQGFLDDNRAAEMASEQLIAKSPIGAPKLRLELLRRGCSRPLAESMVEKHCSGQDSFSTALGLLEARRRSFETKLATYRRRLESRGSRRLDAELRAKLSASMLSYLAGRGFGDSESRQAVREFCERLIGSDD